MRSGSVRRITFEKKGRIPQQCRLQLRNHFNARHMSVDLSLVPDQAGVAHLGVVGKATVKSLIYRLLTAKPLRRFIRTTTIKNTKVRKKM